MPLSRRDLIQTTNFVLTAVIASLAIIKMIILGFDPLPIPAFFVVTVGLINAIYIRFNGSVDIAAKILITTALFGLGFSSFYTGGIGASVVLLAPMIPIMAVLLINTRTAWMTFGLVCLMLAIIFVLELYGYVPENTIDPDLILMSRYIVLICLCLIATWIVSHSTAQSRTLMAKLEQQSNIDYLTGILNRRAIETELFEEINKAKYSNTWLSFIMADVDFFKLYNDSNGHLIGDNCLKDIARLISHEGLRPADIVGRFGGEEFVLILPNTKADEAKEVAENLRQLILKQNIPYGPKNNDPVTLTLGVTSAYGQDISDTEQLIRDADTALYQGKHQGRNRVVSTISGCSDTPHKI
jgi:diguanylate cyclase (GGDEF)-like protein